MPSVRVVPSEQWKVVVRGAADPRALRSLGDPAVCASGLQGASGCRNQCDAEDAGADETEAFGLGIGASVVFKGAQKSFFDLYVPFFIC